MNIILPVRHYQLEEEAMGDPATTRMSSKGQVVIPETIRKKFGLETGTQFVVIGDRDVVILKSLSPPSMEEFDDLIGKARSQARKTSLRRPDTKEAVSREKGRK
jgi:AbrB family looped-hinge helix DNA binding protein